MPSAAAPNPLAPPEDDLDALFNFDAGIDDAVESTDNIANASRTAGNVPATNLDEEVVVTKRRTPIAKLDDDRILSSRGIRHLQKVSKKMRFKGKGHEFSDMTRLLNMYQFWLDDMYPRAKFADGLMMIEKLGHKKKIQLYRREWIEEGKPKVVYDGEGEDEDSQENAEAREADDTTNDASALQRSDGVGSSTAAMSGALPAPSPATPQEEELPPEDELDALMAEEAQGPAPTVRQAEPDDFADEEEAMAGMDW